DCASKGSSARLQTYPTAWKAPLRMRLPAHTEADGIACFVSFALSAADDVPLGFHVQRGPVGHLVAQPDFRIQLVIGDTFQRLADFARAEQLEGLTRQVAVVVPLHCRQEKLVLAAVGVLVVAAVDQRSQREGAQFVIPELVTRTCTYGALATYVFDLVPLVAHAALPEPILIEESVKGIFGIPVVGNGHAVAVFAVVAARAVMPPQAVPRLGIEGHVVVVGIGLGALVVHRHVDIALPLEILDQWLGMDNLRDARQLYGTRRSAIGEGHLAIVGRL